ncbi:MAG TPA: nuclear transport factor 2 family protein [Candidatus Angelobacter sp.]|nr:nuclear transport factor 2 family protein [Candidatus Angelobacter sp.]
MRLLRILIPLAILLAGCSGPPKHPTWRNATGAEQFERLMWQSMHDKNWAEVESHLAPAFVGVNAQGKALDRDGWIEHCKSNLPADYSLGEVQVQPAGGDMIVSYVVRFSKQSAGHVTGLRVVSVWQSLKRGWVLISQSHTPVS